MLVTDRRWLSRFVAAIVLICASVRPTQADEPTKSDDLLPANQSSLTIPLQRAQNWLCAQVMVNDTDAGWFVVDTGCTGTFIDTAVAAKLGLKSSSDSVDLSDHNGTVSFAKVQSVKVGPIVYRPSALARILHLSGGACYSATALSLVDSGLTTVPAHTRRQGRANRL